jgi:glycine/D-amino acid oxidase-like deaminating enzyme
MTDDACFAPDFREQPYWWDAAPLPVLPETGQGAATDVAIVGSGYTGLSAALHLLRGGRSVTILDAEDAGYGASRRNAGYIGRTLKRDVAWLAERYGLDHAVAIYRELDEALQLVQRLITDEGIECHLNICGRFIGATSPAHYEILAKDLAAMKRHLGFDFHMLSRAEQRTEMATDFYFGGAVIPDLGALHPGLYHKGLLDRVLAAGGVVRARNAVLGIEPVAGGGRFRLRTGRGEVTARDVIVATNGYTPAALPWHARRVIPFSAYMAATEPLTPERMARLIPHGRTCIETLMNITYVRPAPDDSRILFGGLTGRRTPSVRAIAPRLRAQLTRVLPDLDGVKLSHAWTGRCAGTFDFMPHIGVAQGIHYALGYNFAGVPMGTWLGRKLALKILGSAEGSSAFERHAPPTLPLYGGKPWFVPLAMRYFDWHDRRIAARGA